MRTCQINGRIHSYYTHTFQVCGCPLCASLWMDPVCVRFNQTFIVLFWDAVSVQGCKMCLALDEVILKSKSGQIMALQPHQQILCMYLFGKRDSEGGRGRQSSCVHTQSLGACNASLCASLDL